MSLVGGEVVVDGATDRVNQRVLTEGIVNPIRHWVWQGCVNETNVVRRAVAVAVSDASSRIVIKFLLSRLTRDKGSDTTKNGEYSRKNLFIHWQCLILLII